MAAMTAPFPSRALPAARGALSLAIADAPTTRHIEGHGTPDAAWQAWGGLAALPRIDAATLAPPGGRAVIVAPHPDDEVLACGGLMQLLHAQGTRTVLLAVTDGDASHPGSALLPPEELVRVRPRETQTALRALGVGGIGGDAGPMATQVLRARLADGKVRAHIDQLQNLLHQLLRPDDVVFVTWRQDGHPDHEACGLAVAMAARSCGAALVEMPVWSWHWATPGDSRLPWRRACRLDLGPEVMQRKREAVHCFQTQLQEDPSTGQAAILPPHVLARLLHPYEIYFT